LRFTFVISIASSSNTKISAGTFEVTGYLHTEKFFGEIHFALGMPYNLKVFRGSSNEIKEINRMGSLTKTKFVT
jgi:hypothetical protein